MWEAWASCRRQVAPQAGAVNLYKYTYIYIYIVTIIIVIITIATIILKVLLGFSKGTFSARSREVSEQINRGPCATPFESVPASAV